MPNIHFFFCFLLFFRRILHDEAYVYPAPTTLWKKKNKDTITNEILMLWFKFILGLNLISLLFLGVVK